MIEIINKLPIYVYTCIDLYFYQHYKPNKIHTSRSLFHP